MADKEYDIVYVGAGNKNFTHAMYATKFAGLKVAMFETRHEEGGGWSSEESPAPGFITNQCSHIHCYLHHHAPVWIDIPEWKEYGVQYAKPRVSQSVVFEEDDTWCGTYTIWEKDHRQKTYDLLKRWSKKDADTYAYYEEKWFKYIYPASLEWSFSPPVPLGQPDVMDRLIMNPESGIKPHWMMMSGIQLMRELFDTPEVQSWGIRGAQSAGVNPTAYGSALIALCLMMVYMDTIVIKGGTHQCAHASYRVLMENGGELYHNKTVEKILIENGKATGIRLTDGTEIAARLGVCVGAHPYDLVHDMTDPAEWPSDVQKLVKYLERDFITVSWYTWALKEQPVYKAEAFDPDLRQSCWINLSRKGLDGLYREAHERLAGYWPKREDYNLVITNWSTFAHDYYAPPGPFATVQTEQFLQPGTKYPEETWKQIEKTHADDLIWFWNRYCENVHWDNVIGYNPVTSYYIAKHARNYGPQGNWCVIDMDGPQLGRTRPIAQLADVRNFPIKNLYPASSAWHPSGGATSEQGYWLYHITAEQHGLPTPPEKDWSAMVQKTLKDGEL